MWSPNKQDLSYITNDNWRVILDRINAVIKDKNNKPPDIVELLIIRHYIYEKFDN